MTKRMPQGQVSRHSQSWKRWSLWAICDPKGLRHVFNKSVYVRKHWYSMLGIPLQIKPKMSANFSTYIPMDTNIITGDIFFFKLFRVASSTVSYAKEMIDILVLNWLKESTCWHHMTEVILVKHMQITSLACWLITLRWLSIDDCRIKSKYLLLILPQPTFLASLLINTFASIWGIE